MNLRANLSDSPELLLQAKSRTTYRKHPEIRFVTTGTEKSTMLYHLHVD